jgi:hypothetical protein
MKPSDKKLPLNKIPQFIQSVGLLEGGRIADSI